MQLDHLEIENQNFSKVLPLVNTKVITQLVVELIQEFKVILNIILLNLHFIELPIIHQHFGIMDLHQDFGNFRFLLNFDFLPLLQTLL